MPFSDQPPCTGTFAGSYFKARFEPHAESHQWIYWVAQAYKVKFDLLRQTVRAVAASNWALSLCLHCADGSLLTSLPVAVAAGGEAPLLQAFLDDLLVCSPSARGNGEDTHDSPPPQWRAKVAGISAPCELSVAWLWTALHSADQFLYIAVTL